MRKLFEFSNKFASLIHKDEYYSVLIELDSGFNWSKIFPTLKEAESFLYKYIELEKKLNIMEDDCSDRTIKEDNLIKCFIIYFRGSDDLGEPIDNEVGAASIYKQIFNLDKDIKLKLPFSEMLLKFFQYSKQFSPYYTQNPKELINILKGKNHKFITSTGYLYDDSKEDEGHAVAMYQFFKYLYEKYFPSREDYPSTDEFLVSLDELEENGLINSDREFSDFWKELRKD